MSLTAAIAYAVLALVLAAFTAITIRPLTFGRELAPIMAFGGMVIEWFLIYIFAAGLLVTIAAAQLGALALPLGWAALAVHVACWIVLGRYMQRVHRSHPVLDGRPILDSDLPFALAAESGRAARAVSWLPSMLLRLPSMLDVEVTRDVLFHEPGRGVRLLLDVYRPRDRAAERPVVLYVHGGGWIAGSRRQSRFMLYELAASGFVVFSISYRLAPRYPLPRAIEDAKASLAWVRAHAGDYGGDGRRIAVVGGSAGGHLAAMLALTPNDPRFQPGFEEADTSVRGSVILYGAADLTRVFEEEPHAGYARFLERVVFQRRFADDPELFRRSQPVTHIRKDAPPILLVHGELDSLVPIDVSRRFAAAMRAAGAENVHLLEVPHAHHAFEMFPTPVHQRAVRVIVRFLRWVEERD